MMPHKMLTLGLVLMMCGIAGCSSSTPDPTGAAQDDVGGQAAPPPLYPPTQSCTTPIASNAWTGSIGPNGWPTSQPYTSYIQVSVESGCTQVTWTSTSAIPASGGGTLSLGSCVPSCLANPMMSMTSPAGKKNQAVLFYSGAIGTTVFQVQDSTGTLGGTYTVNVIAQ